MGIVELMAEQKKTEAKEEGRAEEKAMAKYKESDVKTNSNYGDKTRKADLFA